MATEIKLPRLGQGMESGTIVRWLKSEGDAVKKHEPLYELDTDKVTQEVESDLDGVLLKIVVAEGEVEVGSTIAMIGSDGDDSAGAPAPESAPAKGDAEPVAKAAAAARPASGSEPQASSLDSNGGPAGSGAPSARACAGSGGAGSTATPSVSVPISAIVEPTSVSPSRTTIFSRTPSTSDSTSCVTLSVSSS